MFSYPHSFQDQGIGKRQLEKGNHLKLVLFPGISFYHKLYKNYSSNFILIGLFKPKFIEMEIVSLIFSQ